MDCIPKDYYPEPPEPDTPEEEVQDEEVDSGFAPSSDNNEYAEIHNPPFGNP